MHDRRQAGQPSRLMKSHREIAEGQDGSVKSSAVRGVCSVPLGYSELPVVTSYLISVDGPSATWDVSGYFESGRCTMSQVYLTRAGNFGPIREAIESAGGNLDRVISKASLSPLVFQNPDLLVPLRDFFLTMEYAARELDDPLFGANLGKHTSLRDLGDFGTIIAGQSTLQQAIDFANSNACGSSLAAKCFRTSPDGRI